MRSREQLLDIPEVLGSSSEELQQNQIETTRDGNANALDLHRLSALEDRRLPGTLAYDEVDRIFPGDRQPREAGQGVRSITMTHVCLNAEDVDVVPKIRRQTFGAQRQEIHIAGRSADAMSGHGGGADDGERNLTLAKERRDRPEQAQPMSSSRQRDRCRPTCR